MDEVLEPFYWWHSGKYWYCSLQRNPESRRVSGCGITRPQAVTDAHRDLLRLEGKRRLRVRDGAGT